jgi:hypothetical protein
VVVVAVVKSVESEAVYLVYPCCLPVVLVISGQRVVPLMSSAGGFHMYKYC